MIKIVKAHNTPPTNSSRAIAHSLDKKTSTALAQCIDKILRNPKGLPNGKGRRTTLTLSNAQNLKSALIEAVEYASVWASKGPLQNRVQGVGAPPDNAPLLFIDDIIRACKKAGLKPGLRYVSDLESLPVSIYIELAPLIWPASAKNPRRLFERWQRLQSTLVRE